MPHRGGCGEKQAMVDTFEHLLFSLTDCHSKRDLIGNCLLHSLKGMVGADGHN